MLPNSSLPIDAYLYCPEVKEPILFLAWKHHLQHIKTVVLKNQQNFSINFKSNLCKRFGSSVIDLYSGNLSPSEISKEIFDAIIRLGNETRNNYFSWIDSSLGQYQKITLSDGSSWTLKKGNNPKRYIHIHPSRYARNTTRVKATVLKTVVAYCFLFDKKKGTPSVEQLNFSRKILLNLPPLKEGVLNHQIFWLVKYQQQ